jgi:hypothetical protein
MERSNRFRRPTVDSSVRRVLTLGNVRDNLNVIDGGNASTNTNLWDRIDGEFASTTYYPDDIQGGNAFSSYN